MTRAKDISKILTDADISGNIDVDGVTNLDVVDIDGALTQDGGAVFNEASADVDFRVEGNTDTHALFVQGGSNHVGINNTSPNSQLTGADNLVVGNTGVATSGMTFVGSGGSGSQALIHFSDATSGTARYDGFIGYEHTDRFMKFGTAQAEQVRIHSNGVLSASDGIALGVGTANTASNVLDDYEEGTYGTSATNGIITSASGSITCGTSFLCNYTKIGNQVTANGWVVVSAVSSPSGQIHVTLPFTVGTGYPHRAMGSLFLNGVPFVSDYNIIFAEESNAWCYVMGIRTNTSELHINANGVSVGDQFGFGITYQVD